MVYLDRPTYDRILKEVPTFKMISQSTLIDRLKINGSLARVAIRHLERDGQIKRIIHHHGQLVYSECFPLLQFRRIDLFLTLSFPLVFSAKFSSCLRRVN